MHLSHEEFTVKKVIFFALFFMLVSAFIYAGGKVEETRFNNEISRYYLSAGVKDGNFDTLVLDLGAIAAPKGRSFVERTFTVYGADGAVAYTHRVALEKAKVLPNVIYDGTNTAGELLRDGAYVFTIMAKDDKNNESVSKPFSLVVDNTAPEIRTVRLMTGNIVTPQEQIDVKVSIDGSAEVLWEAWAINKTGARTSVFSRKSETPQKPPQLWSWSGSNSNGEAFEDGAYTLVIAARDAAGNSAELALDTSVIVSSAGALSLRAEATVISPNGDEIMDSLPLIIGGDAELLNSFATSEIVVLSTAQETAGTRQTHATIKGQGVPQFFDGKDENGRVLEDGVYSIAVHLISESNDVYVTNSIPVRIDTAAPDISFSIDTSPSQTPVGEPLYFGGETRNELKGSVLVKDKEATISIEVMHKNEVFLTSNANATASPIGFVVGQDGLFGDQMMEDGLYEIVVSARDEAGNVAKYPSVRVIRDTQEKTMELSTAATTVSGRKDPLQISALYSQDGLKESLLKINNAAGETVRSESLPYHLPSYYWNARNNQNKLVEDGTYSVELTAVYYNGHSTTERVSDIVVDSTPPTLEVFSPNTDIVSPKGENEATKMLIVTQESSDESGTWRSEVRNIFDAVIAEQGFDTLKTFTWDAKNDSGEIVPDGDYFYILIGEDAAGNRIEKTASFIVDTSIYESGKVLSIDGEMPKIYFPRYSDDIFALKGDEEKTLYENLLAVRSVAKLLKNYKEHSVTITGHAARLLSGARAVTEQNEVLIPLSRKRAEAIRRALVILGIDENRITMRAIGGTEPATKTRTAKTIWRNRRVEFEIIAP